MTVAGESANERANCDRLWHRSRRRRRLPGAGSFV